MDSYREAYLEDVSDIKVMMDEYIGFDFYTESDIIELINSSDRKIFVCEDDRSGLIGCLIVYIASIEETIKILNLSDFNKERLYDSVGQYCDLHNSDIRVGIFKTIFVVEKYRGMGISVHLNDCAIEYFKQQGLKVAIGTALKQPNGKVNARRAAVSSGFVMLDEVEKPWITKKSYCPYCKKEYCECNGIIFIKKL